MTLIQRAMKAWTTPANRDVVSRPLIEFLDGGNIALPDAGSASYGQIYQSQIWVHVVVNKLARSIGRLPLKVYRKTGETRERVTSGSLYDLLAAPSGRLSPMRWKEHLIADMAVYGNAMLIKVAPNRQGVPLALMPVPPLGWRQQDDGSWSWQSGGEPRDFAPEQIVHLAHYTPGWMWRRGMAVSPLEPLRQTLAIEYAAQALGVASFANGARPSGVLQSDQDLKKETLTKLREEIVKLHGGPANQFKPAILSNGLKWQPMSWNLNESAVIEHRKLTREEVAAVYDIPPPLIGILDRATFSNIETQARLMYTETLGPWLTLVEETLQTQLLDDVPEWADHYVEFDLNEVLKGDQEKRFRAYSQALTAGWLTQNEVRALENRPAVDDPDADVLHRAMNLTPDLTTPPPDTPPVDPAGGPTP